MMRSLVLIWAGVVREVLSSAGSCLCSYLAMLSVCKQKIKVPRCVEKGTFQMQSLWSLPKNETVCVTLTRKAVEMLSGLCGVFAGGQVLTSCIFARQSKEKAKVWGAIPSREPAEFVDGTTKSTPGRWRKKKKKNPLHLQHKGGHVYFHHDPACINASRPLQTECNLQSVKQSMHTVLLFA